MEKYNIVISDETIEVINPSLNKFIINGNHSYIAELLYTSTEINRLLFSKQNINVLCKRISETDFEIWIKHHVLRVRVEDSRTQLLSRFAKDIHSKFEQIIVKAPMPGLVKAIEVKSGDIIQPGKGLIILEAMKMENEIRSSVHGKIKTIEVSNNTSVEKDQTLIIIDPIEI